MDEERVSDGGTVEQGRKKSGLSTRAVHGEGGSDPAVRPGDPVVPPIVQSATFHGWGPDGGERRYGRLGNNPTLEAVAGKVAALEGTESALLTASGMAATALSLLALLDEGDHVVASKHLYGMTRSFLADELPRRGIETTFVDPEEPGAWSDALRSASRVVFFEIPTNPTLRIFDPSMPARASQEAGASFLVDATFASPVNLRMAEHGADLVIHSATKYLGGHSDLMAGVVAGNEAMVERVRKMLILYGPVADPQAAWLLDRGLRTLDVRVRRQNESALELARWLEGRGPVERVIHPGLPSHPDHGRAKELLDGFGGMLSFVLTGGGDAADRFVRGLKTALVAPSLGGVETLVSQPRLTSHVGLSAEEREAAGIPDGFVRVSVGIEDLADLKADFEAALAAS